MGGRFGAFFAATNITLRYVSAANSRMSPFVRSKVFLVELLMKRLATQWLPNSFPCVSYLCYFSCLSRIYAPGFVEERCFPRPIFSNSLWLQIPFYRTMSAVLLVPTLPQKSLVFRMFLGCAPYLWRGPTQISWLLFLLAACLKISWKRKFCDNFGRHNCSQWGRMITPSGVQEPHYPSSWCSHHLVKWLNWLGARAALKCDKLRVRIPGVCCLETKILTPCFLQIPTWTRGFGVDFSHCTTVGARRFHYSAQVGNRCKLFSSTRLHSGCCARNRPTGERHAEKKACCQLANHLL